MAERRPNRRLKGEDAFVIAMAQNNPVQEAARLAGLSRSQGFRLMNHPRILERIAELRRCAALGAATALSEAGTAAVGRLMALLACDNPSVALNAAKAMLEYGIRLRQEIGVEERLARLERYMSGEQAVPLAGGEAGDDDEEEVAG